jgi:hypothetical protein
LSSLAKAESIKAWIAYKKEKQSFGLQDQALLAADFVIQTFHSRIDDRQDFG